MPFRQVRATFRNLLSVSVLLVAFASIPVWAPALAENLALPPAAFKALPEGTAMVWENMDTGERIESVVGQTRGQIVSWIWKGRNFSSWGHVCIDCVAAGIPPDGGTLGFLYPLEVGKTVKFSRVWGGQTWRDEITVSGTERIEVPAGTFDTFVLLRQSQQEGSDWRAEQRSWYAPDLGWVVRFEGFNNRGTGERWQAVQFD
ncbi:hypothetical protein [Pelagibius sp.]|uniref:TapB family protein n=1 Tax=Pelagibius sp. TaxID=1931238 RepID=UPI00261CA414|nr:hypothetical protein [Pelagibius sp.]